MDKQLTTTTTATDADADLTEAATVEQDAAGGIALKGRNRACARARVLAGMVLTSGIVITLSTLDTSVSAPR
ncbi:hypothetical protein [Streptomyces sp. NPDC093060]|uniref:hypothetical protein n=1 Tax=Streptomyces sp. NPDC093060 TaxID=3366019 RepID=UPI003819A39D